jgi:hypothetical protein
MDEKLASLHESHHINEGRKDIKMYSKIINILIPIFFWAVFMTVLFLNCSRA